MSSRSSSSPAPPARSSSSGSGSSNLPRFVGLELDANEVEEAAGLRGGIVGQMVVWGSPELTSSTCSRHVTFTSLYPSRTAKMRGEKSKSLCHHVVEQKRRVENRRLKSQAAGPDAPVPSPGRARTARPHSCAALPHSILYPSPIQAHFLSPGRMNRFGWSRIPRRSTSIRMRAMLRASSIPLWTKQERRWRPGQ